MKMTEDVKKVKRDILYDGISCFILLSACIDMFVFNTHDYWKVFLYVTPTTLILSILNLSISIRTYQSMKIKKDSEFLKYSFINNSILLTTDTINRNGFYEIWRQESKEHSIQILCFNQEKEEFQAFDRFHWMDEPKIINNPPSWYEIDGIKVHSENFEENGIYYKKDLWTPIKLHLTQEWVQEHLK